MKRGDRLRAEAALQAIYDKIPVINCKGLCWDGCNSIVISEVERDRIARLGYNIPPFDERRQGYRCPALDRDQRCAVYEARPTVCRLFGAADGMKCGYNCETELMPYRTAIALYISSLQIGGKRPDESDPVPAGKLLDTLIDRDYLDRITTREAIARFRHGD